MMTPRRTGVRKPVSSAARGRPHEDSGSGFTMRLAVGFALGLLAFLLVPSAPALVRQSWLLRGVITGGITTLTTPWDLLPAAADAMSVIAALTGEMILTWSGQPFEPGPAIGALALAGGISAGIGILRRRSGPDVAASTMLAIVLLAFLWIAGVLPGPYRRSTGRLFAQLVAEPRRGHYDFDGDIYLRTYFEMKHGGAFYPSFATACVQDSRGLGAPRSTLNYREPLLFDVWRSLPGRNGIDLRGWFLAFVIIVVIGGYHIARAFVGPGPALLAPLALTGYFATAIWSEWFLFPELWGGGLAVLAMLAVLRGRWWAGALLIALAVAVRELMVFLVPAYLLGRILCTNPRHRMAHVIAGAVLPLVPLVIQVVAAPSARGPSAWSLAPWLHGGPATLVDCLRFSSNFVPMGAWLLPWVPLVSLLGAIAIRPRWRASVLLTSIGLALLGLFTFSAGPYGLYWGAILQPLALAAFPIAAHALEPRA